MSDEALTRLREPFPDAAIDKLPRDVQKGGQRSRCNVCGGYHAPASIHLDYVGHANVTHRLLDVDLHWTWEPMALTDTGLPHIILRGNTAELWIRLTVAGVTRIGVGTASESKGELSKELIGDAIRNAAMRFGVALDLWSKGDAWESTQERGRQVEAVDVDTPEAAQFQVHKVNKELYGDDADIKREALRAAFGAAGLTRDDWPTLTAEQADLIVAELRSAAGDDGAPLPPLPGGAPPPEPEDEDVSTVPTSGSQRGEEVPAEQQGPSAPTNAQGSPALGEEPGTPNLAGLRAWAEGPPLNAPHADQYKWLRTLATGMFKAGFTRWQLVRLPKMLSYTPAKGKAQESSGLPDRRSLARVVKDAAEEALVDLDAEEAP